MPPKSTRIPVGDDLDGGTFLRSPHSIVNVWGSENATRAVSHHQGQRVPEKIGMVEGVTLAMTFTNIPASGGVHRIHVSSQTMMEWCQRWAESKDAWVILRDRVADAIDEYNSSVRIAADIANSHSYRRLTLKDVAVDSLDTWYDMSEALGAREMHVRSQHNSSPVSHHHSHSSDSVSLRDSAMGPRSIVHVAGEGDNGSPPKYAEELSATQSPVDERHPTASTGEVSHGVQCSRE